MRPTHGVVVLDEQFRRRLDADALALGRQRGLTAVVSNHRGDVTLARWALTLAP